MLPSILSNILVFAIVVADAFLIIVYRVYTREAAESVQMGYMHKLIEETRPMIMKASQ